MSDTQSRTPSLYANTKEDNHFNNQLSEIGCGMNKLNFEETNSSSDYRGKRDELNRTPPPASEDDVNMNENETKTPPALSSTEKHEDGLETPKSDAPDQPSIFKRTKSSPPKLDDSPPFRRISITSIPPQSPSQNALQHALLTPITRNTNAHSFSQSLIIDDDELNCLQMGSDHLSTLAIPGSDKNYIHSPLMFANFTPSLSLNSLPDEIFLASGDSTDQENKTLSRIIGSPGTPLTPSSHSRSSNNLDINSLLQTELQSSTHDSEGPSTPSSPLELTEHYNNVSAPSEFFEYLANNNNSSLPLGGSTHSTSFEPPRHQKPLLTRGISMNTSLRRYKPQLALPQMKIPTNPKLQYQPSRRDDSLTDVGISKNTEGVNDIFAARSPKKTDDQNDSIDIQQRYDLIENQHRVPSLHRANRLRNDTSSFTDGEYSWEDEEDIRLSYANQINQDDNLKNNPDLFLPEDQSSLEKKEDVGNIVMSSALRQKAVITKKSTIKTSKMGKNGDPLEWIHEIQSGSENKVGEAASSKFLTKGISSSATSPFPISYRRSPTRLHTMIVPQSVNRATVRRNVDDTSCHKPP